MFADSNTLIFFYFLRSALQMMSLADGITVSKLMESFPEELDGISDSEYIRDRLTIESMYRTATEKQFEEFELIRKDEALKIPRKIDYGA